MAKMLIKTTENNEIVELRVVGVAEVEYRKMSDSLYYFTVKTDTNVEIPLVISEHNKEVIDDAIAAINRIYAHDNVLVRVELYTFNGSTYIDSIK